MYLETLFKITNKHIIRLVCCQEQKRKQNEILLGSIIQRRVFPVLGVHHADDIITEFKCIV